MNYVLHPDAETDLQEAAEFYRKQAGNQLALAFVDEFERSAKLLLEHPPVRSDMAQRSAPDGHETFPCSVIYHVVDEQIRVLAVAHHSRRPGYWQDRD